MRETVRAFGIVYIFSRRAVGIGNLGLVARDRDWEIDAGPRITATQVDLYHNNWGREAKRRETKERCGSAEQVDNMTFAGIQG